MIEVGTATRLPAWLRDLEDELCHPAAAKVEAVRAALARAHTVNGPSDRPWNGAAFIWLQGLENKRASDAVVAQVLDALLAEGLDPNISGKPSLPPKDVHEAIRVNRPPAAEKKRQYVGVMTTPNSDPWAREGDLLTRVCWAGRHRNNLVTLVSSLIAAGANTDALHNGRGPWHAACATGNVEVMKELAKDKPEGYRPPNYVHVILSGLLKDTLSSTGGRVDDALRSAGLAWLLSTYPPTDDEVKEVFRALLPKRMREPEALMRWLMLPASGLSHPGKLPNAPKGFNPWVCAGVMEDDLQQARAFLDTLAGHPWWGRPEQVRACRLTSDNRPGLAFIDANAAKSSLMDAWLIEGHRADSHESKSSFRHYLFEVAQRIGAQPTPVLPQLLAKLYDEPDEAASEWLMCHREAWAPCTSTGDTPWHYVPRRESFVRWMDGVGVPCNTINKQGEHGFASYMVDCIVNQNHNQLKWCMERLGRGDIDIEGVARGLSLRGWMSSHKNLVRLLPKGTAVYDHNTLSAAFSGLSLPAIRNAWEKGGRFGPTAQTQNSVLQAWAFSAPATSRGGSCSDAVLAKRAAALQVMGKATQHGLSHRAYNRVFEFAHAQSRYADTRPDLRAYWEFMHNVPETAWDFRDLAAVSKWFLVEIKAHCKQAAAGKTDPGRPWKSPTWESWSPQMRGRVLRGVMMWMGHSRHQDSASMQDACDWLLDQAQDLRNDFWHGIAPAAAARIANGLHDRSDRIAATPFSNWARQAAAAIARCASLSASLPGESSDNCSPAHSPSDRLRF